MKCAVVAVLIALAVHGAGALLLAFLLQVASLNERMTPSELDFASVDLSLSETDTEAPVQQREPLPALPPPAEIEPPPPIPDRPPEFPAFESVPSELALERLAESAVIEEPPAALDLPEPPVEPLPERSEPVVTSSESAQETSESQSAVEQPPESEAPPPEPAPDQSRIETAAALKSWIDVKKIYPEESRLAREEGVVLLELTLTDRGSVAETKVVRSSGYPALDAAAMKAGKKAKFKPATVNGRPVATTVRLPLDFRLRAEGR